MNILKPEDEGLENLREVNSAPLVREMDNIMAVELFPNGDGVPLVFYTYMGRRYLAEVTMWDITNVPFYQKRGLKERLTAERAKHEGE